MASDVAMIFGTLSLAGTMNIPYARAARLYETRGGGISQRKRERYAPLTDSLLAYHNAESTLHTTALFLGGVVSMLLHMLSNPITKKLMTPKDLKGITAYVYTEVEKLFDEAKDGRNTFNAE